MDYFSNKDFTNYLKSIPYETRNKVFTNISLNKIKFHNAIKQIGAVTQVNIERLSPQVLEKYKSNNTSSCNANRLSRKKDDEEQKKSSHSNQKHSTEYLVESSASSIESKENHLSSSNILEESSISTINKETYLKFDGKEEVIVFPPEYKSVLNVEIKAYTNKYKTQQKSLLLDKYSENTKSHKIDLMPDKLSQSKSTKESSSSKIDQNKIDISKVNNMMNQKPNNNKHKLTIINLFGDGDESELKIPPSKKINSDVVKTNVKNNTKQDKNIKMRRKSICVSSEEKKKQTSVGDSSSKTKNTTEGTSHENNDIRSSSKTKGSREEIGARRKSIHHEVPNEGEERRTRSKSREIDVSNSTATKVVRSCSKTKDSRDDITTRRKSIQREVSNEREEKRTRSKSREIDVSNSTASTVVRSCSKTKDSRDDITTRRKSIQREVSNEREKKRTRSKSREIDVSNSTASTVVRSCSKTKDSRDDITTRRKSIHREVTNKEGERRTRPESHEKNVSNSTATKDDRSCSKTKDSRDDITTRRKSIHHEVSNEEGKRRTRSKSREIDVSNSSKTKMVRRDSFYQESSAENVKIRRNRSKTRDVGENLLKITGDKVVRRQSIHQKIVSSEDISLKSDDKEMKSLKSLDKEEISTDNVSLKVRRKSCYEENSDKKQVASKILMRRKTVCDSLHLSITKNKKDISLKPQTPKRRTSLYSEANSDIQISSNIDNSRMRNSLEKIEQRTKRDKNKDSLKTEKSIIEANVRRKSCCEEKSRGSKEDIKRLQFRDNGDSERSESQRKKSISSKDDLKASEKDLKKLTLSKEFICKEDSKIDNFFAQKHKSSSSNEKRRSEDHSATNSRVAIKRSSSAANNTKSNLSEDDSRSKIPLGKRRKTTSEKETSIHSISSSTLSLIKSTSSELNLSQDESPKRKRPPLIIEGSSDDSSNCEESPSKRKKNHINYGDLIEQMKTVPSTQKTLDFVAPLSISTNGFTKPDYNDDKNQDMTYDSVLVVEEKENTPLKLVVRRRSVRDVEQSRKQIISRRHSFHFEDVKPKVESVDNEDEENIRSVKQEPQNRSKSSCTENANNRKKSSKSNKKTEKIESRRKSVHEIRSRCQTTSDVKPIKSILKKPSLDSNETILNRDSNVSNSFRRDVDRNDNNITPRSLPVTIDLENIDIDQIFPTNNNGNGLTLEISSDENSPTREEDTKFSVSIDSAICADFANDVEKELEERINTSLLDCNYDMLKLTLEMNKLNFITTQEAIGVTKSHFVSLFYIYKQYFKMRERVEYEKKLGMDPNLVVKMDYFSKRRESDLKKMYQKLIIFKVDNFIIILFFDHLANLLKDEFKKYKEITEAVIYYFIQRIIWILMENFMSPSDEKCLFNHITSCECVEYIMAKGEKYLRYATTKDKKMNAYFCEFTFQNSSDKMLRSDKPETVTKPSESLSNSTEERSTVIHEIRLKNSDQALKTVPKILSTFIKSTENCSQQSTPSTSKPVHQKPSAQQRRNLSLPMIETEEQRSIKPNPPAKRRGRPPRKLQKIKPTPDRLSPNSSKGPSPNVMVTVSSEEFLPSTTDSITSSEPEQPPQQDVRRRSENSTAVIPQMIESFAAPEEQLPVETMQEPRQYMKLVDQNKLINVESSTLSKSSSNSQITNDILKLLQHPKPKEKQPKQRIITLDGVIVNQSHEINQNLTKPSSVPEVVKNNCQTPIPLCTPMSNVITNTTISDHTKQSSVLPSQNIAQNAVQTSVIQNVIRSRNPAPQSTSSSVINTSTNPERKRPMAQNNLNSFQDSIVAQNVSSKRTSKLSETIDLRRKVNQERIQNVPASQSNELQRTNRTIEQNISPNRTPPVTAGENNINQVQNRPLCPKLRPHKTIKLPQNVPRPQLVSTSENDVNLEEINSQTTAPEQNIAVHRSSEDAIQEQNRAFISLVNKISQNLSLNNNQSSIQKCSTNSQNNTDISVSQNMSQSPVENNGIKVTNVISFQNVDRVAKNGSLRERRQPSPNMSPQSQSDVILGQNNQQQLVQNGSSHSQNNNLLPVNNNNVNLLVQYQNNLNSSANNQAMVQNGSARQQNNVRSQNVYTPTNYPQGQINVGQNNHQLMHPNGLQMVQNNSIVPANQSVQNYAPIAYPQQMALHPATLPQYPQQMTPNGNMPNYPNQQMAPNNHQYPYRMVPQMPVYRTHITHAVHEPIAYNNMDYMNTSRETFARQFYEQLRNDMIHQNEKLPSYDEFIQSQQNSERGQQNHVGRLPPSLPTHRLNPQENHPISEINSMLRAIPAHRSLENHSRSHLPQPIPAHSSNYPRSEMNSMQQPFPTQRILENHPRSNLSQPYPGYNSNHSRSHLNSMQQPFSTQSSLENHSRTNLPQPFPAHNHPRSQLSSMQQPYSVHNSNHQANHPRSQLNSIQQPLPAHSSLEHHTRSNLPQPFPTHQANHPRSQLSSMQQPLPSHSSLENHSKSNLPQPFPAQKNYSSLSSCSSQSSNHSNVAEEIRPITLASLLDDNTSQGRLFEKEQPPINCTESRPNPSRPSLIRPNLRQIEILQQNLEQLVTSTEKTTNGSSNSLTTTLQQHSCDMENVPISETPTVIQSLRPLKIRMKKTSSVQENPPTSQMQADVYNPALRNVSRDSGYFSPSDVVLQTPESEANVICDRCLAPSNLMCSGCFVYYCSRECQQLAWPEHMTKCSLVSPPNS